MTVFLTVIFVKWHIHQQSLNRTLFINVGWFVCFIVCLQNKINHSVIKDLLDPIKELYEDVRRKALMRLEYEGLHKSEAITTPGARFHNDPAGFAMNRYAYYVCYKCKKVLYKQKIFEFRNVV